jgi:4-alpha-glucanotransferase
MAGAPSSLRALAERVGILSQYLDNDGVERRTSDETQRALLACLGFDAGDEASARRTLADLEEGEANQMVEPVRVARGADATRIRGRCPELASTVTRYEVVAVDERTGEPHSSQGEVRVRPDGAIVGLRAPALAEGTYRLTIRLDDAAVPKTAEQWLAVVPSTCMPVSKVLGDRRAFGIWSNLYAVRSRRGLGIGNLGDLDALVELAADAGADFFGINPLHALRNRGTEISPYGPLSRLYRNPLYLDPGRAPELAACEEAKAILNSDATRAELERARAAERIDYPHASALQRPLLEALWATFRAQASSERREAFERYRNEEGTALRDFATFCAIEEHMTASGLPLDWRRWPLELLRPASVGVAEFRERTAERVDFHAFVQFELDRQLGMAASKARSAGMAIGLYTDMAVGSLASSFDAWAFPGLFVSGAALGAPPDPYSATGQDWGLPPIHPHRLRAGQYRYWRLLLRAALRHCGMLRLDHAMGVLRQFWIPEGRSGVDGAYVSFPCEDLLGLLALESRTHGAVVVGEDLGTVPKGFAARLARHAILSSRVMFFERTRNGGFRRAAAYSPRALVTANTHDQPTLAGWWRGRDIEIRRAVGMIGDDDALEAAPRERAQEKQLLLERLRAERALVRGAPEEPAALCEAVIRYLSSTPSVLQGVSLDDLAGETEPVNVPGVGVEQYPSWSRRMRLDVEDLARDPGVAQALRGTHARARTHKRRRR